MYVAAIVAAGGLGSRVGGEVPKQFSELGDGSNMLLRCLTTLTRCDIVNEIVVAIPPSWHGDWRPDGTGNKPITIVVGGQRRQDSVANALARVSNATDLVVIHDAARPFVSSVLIERTVRAAQLHGAAIAAIPVTDTVKEAGERAADGSRLIRRTLPRETIFLAQTPQAFRHDVLTHAIAAAAAANVTDEAMLVERAGYAVHLVEGDVTNIKITSAEDLTNARALVKGERLGVWTTTRIGSGYDLHRLVPDRALILAGVRIPFERGLAGHSDADLVCHAVTDAVLGATGAGDIGRLFPDSDARWKDADSIQMLRDAVDVVHTAGFSVANVDVTVIAERPKLVPYLDEMRANLARALGIDASAVSIKGKTNEGVGEIGRGEAMACHAVALLQKA